MRPILDLSAFPGASFADVADGRDTFSEDGPAQERTYRAGGVAPRVYSLPRKGFPEDAEIERAWQAARLLADESFYVLDPWDEGRRIDVEVGPASSGQTVFALPDDDEVEAYRDYPIAGTASAVVAGTPRAVSSVDTDARTVTLASGATAGQSVKVSYRAYRLCRFGPEVRWGLDEPDWLTGTVEVREVMRDA